MCVQTYHDLSKIPFKELSAKPILETRNANDVSMYGL